MLSPKKPTLGGLGWVSCGLGLVCCAHVFFYPQSGSVGFGAPALYYRFGFGFGHTAKNQNPGVGKLKQGSTRYSQLMLFGYC